MLITVVAVSSALGIPRVSCVGILKDTPTSKALVDFVRKSVPIVEVKWLEEAQQADFKETKINAIETVIGVNKATNQAKKQ